MKNKEKRKERTVAAQKRRSTRGNDRRGTRVHENCGPRQEHDTTRHNCIKEGIGFKVKGTFE